MEKDKYIPVVSRNEAAKVKVSDVIYILRDKRKLRIVTDERDYAFYEQLDNVMPMLDGRFYCCLKGCCINLDKVASMADQNIYFDNGMVFNLGKENFIKAKQRYKAYLKKMITDK